MLKRKLITASITSSIYAIMLPFVLSQSQSNVFFGGKNYYLGMFGFTAAIILYGFPVILIYGTLTSFLSEKAGQVLERKTGSPIVSLLVSISLHLLFGLVLGLFSLAAAIIYYIVDKLLARSKRTYTWLMAGLSILIPLILFVLSILMIRILD